MNTTQKRTPIESFFDDFGTFFSELTDSLVAKAEDEDEKAVIREGAGPVPAQIKEIGAYVSARSTKASRQQISEAEMALKISNPSALFKSGKGLFGSIGSILGNLGLGRILQEIKKIIRLIFDAFGWKVPKWLDVILLIIDQLANLILGTKSPKMASLLSEAEVNYLNELEATVRLQNAVSRGTEVDQDESWD